jgi:acylphosphatase
MPAARLYTIKGRVQGVFFRASTRDVAESLGLTGWLHDGPAHARVDEVFARDVELEAPRSFRTG